MHDDGYFDEPVADVADAESESAMAEVEEADSHERYKKASDHAAGRSFKR